MASKTDYLWTRVARGDTEAFDVVCRELEGPLYGYAYQLVGVAHDAEEVAQEALFRLYRHARKGKLDADEGTPRAFVFSVARNLAIDVLRRRKRETVPTSPSPMVSPDRVTERKLLRKALEDAINLLPENQRSALLMREFGELAYAEIAQAMGASLNEVKVWIHRGRKRLAELIDRDGQFIGAPQPAEGGTTHAM